METTHIRAFIRSVECGSFKAAAEELGYTTSAVSQLVGALEKELGLQLLRRSQKGVQLTEDGEDLLPFARAYLRSEQEILQFAAERKGLLSGKVTIASYSSVAIAWLPGVVRRFKNDYPDIQIEVIDCVRFDLYRHLDRHEADLGFLAYADPMPYDWIPLAEDAVIAVIPEDHPFAGADSLPVEEFEKNDFILSSRGQEKEILEILHQNGVHPDIRYKTYDTPAALALVKMGLGISLVNELSAQYMNDHIVKLPLDPPAKITFGIAVPSLDHMSRASRKFLDYAVKYLTREETV
ncbi:MAG: LysR family transcriptional regulator [Mogibacterium sp.]|nr:LysR family transcriptional regulator [Mogibacterium sp.]